MVPTDSESYERFKVLHPIKIFIADEQEPIYLSQRELTKISEWFAAAIRNEHLNGELGVLRFPDDDLEAWKTLVQYVDETTIEPADPGNDCASVHLVRCWSLEEKYNIPAFQDLIMLELLTFIDNRGTVLSQAVIEAFENTPAGSVLRRLMAESVVELLKCGNLMTPNDLEVFDGLLGFTSALAEALDKWNKFDYMMFGRLPNEVVQCDERLEYMVCGGPEEHWIHGPSMAPRVE